MIVKLSHAIVITLLLYFVAGVHKTNSVQSANIQSTNIQAANIPAADAPSEPEFIAESEVKEISSKFIRAISQGR